MAVKIYVGNALEILPTLEANSVHCSVSSPPYFGLRKYGGSQQCEWPEIEYAPMPGLPPIRLPGCDPDCEHEWGPNLPPSHPSQVEQTKWKDAKAAGHGQTAPSGNYCQKCGGWCGALGNEPALEMYIGHLVAIYREVYKILREDGVAWVVMGDSFVGYHGNKRVPDELAPSNKPGYVENMRKSSVRTSGLSQGNLMMVPHRLALALQADRWIVRNDLVYSKKSPMPESVKGWTWQKHRIKVQLSEQPRLAPGVRRGGNNSTWPKPAEYIDCPGCPKCKSNSGYVLKRGSWRHTRAHEFIFCLVKKMGYFADQEKVREELAAPPHAPGNKPRHGIMAQERWKQGVPTDPSADPDRVWGKSGRNPRSVLSPSPEPFSGKHFAVYPTSLIEPLIKATCPDKCCPKCGKGWSPVVEKRHNPEKVPDKWKRTYKGKAAIDPDYYKEYHQSNGKSISEIYAESLAQERNVIGYRPTCECTASPGMKEVEVPFEPGGDSGDWAPAPVSGMVLDPFLGSGTTSLVAERLGLSSIGIEISLEYSEMARKRIIDDAPMFNKVEIVEA